MTETKILEIIQEWKTFWMNQNQNSEEDRKNYFDRAFGVDANMKYDLAARIAKANSSLETKLQKAVEALKSDCFCEYNESVRPVTLVTQCIYCKTIKELEN